MPRGLSAGRLIIPSPFLDMAIAGTAVFQQVDAALALPSAPVHLDQSGHNGRFASSHDARSLHGADQRAGEQRSALEVSRQPKTGEMLARLLIQRFVDATLYAAGAVPRGVAVAQKCEAGGNQRRLSERRGDSSAVRTARAAGNRCSAAIRSRPLRLAASSASASPAKALIALA